MKKIGNFAFPTKLPLSLSLSLLKRGREKLNWDAARNGNYWIYDVLYYIILINK
jgi:hypothetical protein